MSAAATTLPVANGNGGNGRAITPIITPPLLPIIIVIINIKDMRIMVINAAPRQYKRFDCGDWLIGWWA